ncbi:hypothetical protein [uncultured Novosphingobium sp.]|uniref:hypothetical protein n=1 Tax=uncultured Novosphingobium sp. TaxID=292277 RepID=UPI003749E223
MSGIGITPPASAAAVDAIKAQTDPLYATPGWANYADSAVQTLAAGVRTIWTNAATTKDETQVPAEVGSFWNPATSKIPGRDGDAINIRLKMTVTPQDTTASSLLIEFDIGGTIGVLDSHKFPLTDGAMVAMPITYPLPAFNRSTFAANGATIYVTADGPVTLSNKALLVQRVHRGR